jgi:hypothetical protein
MEEYRNQLEEIIVVNELNISNNNARTTALRGKNSVICKILLNNKIIE